MAKTLALIAHDNKKANLINWVKRHHDQIKPCQLVATGTTGRLLAEATNLEITCLQSGPLGGDQQIGALIVEQKIDMVIFFWDPLEAQPHDPDVKALIRLCAVWNVPTACNESTAELMVTHPDLQSYRHEVPDFSGHHGRM
mgnify:CR=1 FL=1